MEEGFWGESKRVEVWAAVRARWWWGMLWGLELKLKTQRSMSRREVMRPQFVVSDVCWLLYVVDSVLDSRCTGSYKPSTRNF